MGSYQWETVSSKSVSAIGILNEITIRAFRDETQASSHVLSWSSDLVSFASTSIPLGTVVRTRVSTSKGDYTSPSLTVGSVSGAYEDATTTITYAAAVTGTTAYLEKYVYISTPPSTPSSISVTPSAVQEGSTISISWETGSGASSYRLERSINGGTYSQIYSGSTRSYSDTALASWNTVQYRVRAYNSDGYSGYRTSTTTVTVTHNTAPTTPSSITVPELKGGKTATISWGSSTDSDGDSLTYYLERSIDGGTYSTIKSGTSTTSYTDTIGDTWVTATYRVRAYDGKAYSGYKTSSAITVKHFPEFNMKVGGALTASQDGWVKVGGVLKKIEDISIKVNGALKEI